MTTFIGACHCGAVQALLESDAPLPPRACQCGFCRRHGAKTVSSPQARLTLTFEKRPHVYHFASLSSDVMVCSTCGVYIASTIDGPSGKVATLNVVGVGIDELAALDAAPVSYEDESVEEKRARRLAKWTPTEIVQ